MAILATMRSFKIASMDHQGDVSTLYEWDSAATVLLVLTAGTVVLVRRRVVA